MIRRKMSACGRFKRLFLLLSLGCTFTGYSVGYTVSPDRPNVGGVIGITTYQSSASDTIDVTVPAGKRAWVYFTIEDWSDSNDLAVPCGVRLYDGGAKVAENWQTSSKDKVADFTKGQRYLVGCFTSAFTLAVQVSGAAKLTTEYGWVGGRYVPIPGQPSLNMHWNVGYSIKVEYDTPIILTLDPSSVSRTASSGSGSVKVKSNVSWWAESDVSWMRITAGSTGYKDGTILFAIDANSSLSDRTGHITVKTSETNKKMFTLEQAGKQVPTYTVTYKPGAYGTGAQQTATKTKGVTLQLKGALFTRTGYTQSGWTTIDTGASRYALNGNYYDDAAITLYPAWSANKYTVTYDANGGEIGGYGAIHSISVYYGSNYAIFYTNSRPDYRFVGWFTARTGGQQITDKTAMTTARDHTLYAHWESTAPTTYTVTYKPGPYGMGSQQTATKTKGVALTLKGAIFKRDGYRQDGWMTTETYRDSADLYELGASYVKDAAVTLYPYWVEDAVTLKSIFISGSAVLPSGGSGTYVCTATYSDGSKKEVTPQWSIASGGDIASIDLSGKVMVAQISAARNISIRADYSEVYTDGVVMKSWTKGVTISATTARPDLRPQVLAGWSRPIVVSKTAGEYGDATVFKEEDRLFVSWGVGCDEQDVSSRYYTGLYVDGALVGQWHTDELNKGYVAFIKDFDIGQLAAGLHVIRLVADTKEGIAESNEDNNEYELTITVSGPSIPASAYEIEFEGGEGLSSVEVKTDGSTRRVMPSIVCESGKVYALPACAFGYSFLGKRFAGWACSNGKRYDDGMLVFNLAEPGETVTMTAIWE